MPWLRWATLAALLVWPSASAQTPEFAPGQAGGVPAGYALVWADEFDTPGLPDPSRWANATWRNREGWWNGEAQYNSGPRAKNARVEDGLLVIEAHKEALDDADAFPDWGGQAYSSARLETDGLASFTYGFFEARAKLPCGRGSWPAIWTVGEDDVWPRSGEIDILEHVGYAPDTVHGGVHTQAANHTNRRQRGYSIKLPDACTAFHLYQATWTEDEIILGIDNRNYFRVTRDGATDDAVWPFHRPQYLIVNIAIGGGWGGREGIDDAMFPIRLEVDYIRVYQRLAEG